MIITRQDLVDRLNNTGIAGLLTNLQKALVSKATNLFLPEVPGVSGAKEIEDKDFDNYLINSVGPAAASSAVEYAINACKKKGLLSKLSLNGSLINNIKLIQNDDGFPNFSNVLRQFLLPRYAYIDFDQMVDPRHRVDQECGYPKFITPIMYRYMYDRDDMARRVNDIYPDESWAVDPEVYENEDSRNDESKKTPFEKSWQRLCEDYDILGYLYRMDRLCGIGHYGALLLGLDDTDDLEAPVNVPLMLRGMRHTASTKERGLLYMRPFDEYLSFIQVYEQRVGHPRYGLPKTYNLVFLDMTIDAAGASIGTRLNRRVHWSRVIHIADNLQGSLVFGTPRQQPVFNRLLDLRKIKGGSAEMLWKGGFPGIAFEVDPRFVADEPEFDREKFKKEIDEYADGLKRYLTLLGVKASTLSPNVADPSKHVAVQIAAISSYLGVPVRVFLGSEEGRLASSQDKLTWNQRLGKRLKRFVEPYIIRAVIDRFIALGIMPPPKSGRYFVDWSDLNTPTDEDKANLSLKWTQALSQYVASGVIHLVQPMDYMTLIMGMKPSEAKRVIDLAMKAGGFAKLLKVDPSQQTVAGENGVRKNTTTKGEKSGTSRSRPSKRNTADKKREGKSS